MIVVHLVSNWKWTERAEPAALLARAQQAAGADVRFFCDESPPGVADSVADHARTFGLKVATMPLPKHLRWLETWRGVRQLFQQLSLIRPDVIHAHMPNAHLMAALALRGVQKPTPLLVRTCYDPRGREVGLRERLVRRPCADGMIVITAKARHGISRLGLAPGRIAVIEPGIDLGRFDPAGVSLSEARQRFNLPAEAFVIGMVTRIRRARRADLAAQLLHALGDKLPRARILLVGRGSPAEVRRTVIEPAGRMGVADRLIMAGYRTGPDLAAAYRAMDLLLYPRPGTDRSCRTVREAMATGLPVLASKEGFLPHLVVDGVNGRLCDLRPAALAEKTLAMANDPDLRKRMGLAALGTARHRFDLRRQARRTLDFYDLLLTAGIAESGR